MDAVGDGKICTLWRMYSMIRADSNHCLKCSNLFMSAGANPMEGACTGNQPKRSLKDISSITLRGCRE